MPKKPGAGDFLFEDIAAHYPSRRSALLPALHEAQKARGWLSQDDLIAVADALQTPKATVRGVASFYTHYHRRPVGRNLIQLCTNVSCMLNGAEMFLEILKKTYGLDPGGMTPDGRFSLVLTECIGACDMSPAMLVNADLHGNLTPESIIAVLERYS